MTISYIDEKSKEKCEPSFAREVKDQSQSHIERCYQCMACSSGCPVAFAMDFTAHQIIRMTQLGLKERVLNSSAIWICASCETCATRCPNDIQIVQVMDTLRNIAIKEGRTKQTKLPLFHSTFLGSINNYGKVHELSLILYYTIFSGNIIKLKQLFKDALLGLSMFRKGKLAILPTRIKPVAEVKRIFQTTKKEMS